MNAVGRHRGWKAFKVTAGAIRDLLQTTGQTLGTLPCGKQQTTSQGVRFEVHQEAQIKNLFSFFNL
jgi:hypothetical protein